MKCVIDFEGFQVKSDFYIVKELAFRSLEDDRLGHWVFLPPLPWKDLLNHQKVTYKWVINNLHGLKWECGETSYVYLHKILKAIGSRYDQIFVKGLEKMKFLQKFMDATVHNLDDWKCPKFENNSMDNFFCYHHVSPFKHCALGKANHYLNFIKTVNI